MEQLNKVELKGVVGRISIQNIADTRRANILVATNYAYKDKDGTPVIETNWHTVIAWEGRNIKCLDEIVKGTNIHVVGRIRYQKVTLESGHDMQLTEILAGKVEVL